MAKKYKAQPDPDPQIVNDPAVSYPTIPKTQLSVSGESISPERNKSLLERKAEFVRAVLNDMDEETFVLLETEYIALHSKAGNTPYRYSVEQLREKYDYAVKQAEAGEIFSHEEVKNRYKKHR